MILEFVGSILNIKADAIMSLAMASVLLLLGYFFTGRIKFLQKYCIPAPVVGGFLFMFVTWIGHITNIYSFEFDTYFQAPFMLAFFTTVGLGASFSLLKKGGLLFVIYWLVACIVSIIQNILGISLAKVLGLDAAYALLASAISMIGGHSAALAYGTSFEEMGYVSAKLAGAAAATFGLIFAVITGGPLGRKLIEKYNLKPAEDEYFSKDIEIVNVANDTELSSLDVMKNVTSIIVCMALGTLVSGFIGKLIKMNFPTYVGAMFVAAIVRNANTKLKFYNFDYGTVSKIGDVMLSLYLSLALMTLKMWELASLALPMLVILFAQVVVLGLLTYFVIFRVLGKNYDAAVMCAGLMGHGLGATPSAIVNMTALTEKYGMSHRAFMIVPFVGAFLVDIIYQPATIWFIKTFVN